MFALLRHICIYSDVPSIYDGPREGVYTSTVAIILHNIAFSERFLYYMQAFFNHIKQQLFCCKNENFSVENKQYYYIKLYF